jgi:hypothetical protein
MKYILAGYLIYRYFYVIEYSYNFFYYSNELRKKIFGKQELQTDETWLLCDEDESEDDVCVEATLSRPLIQVEVNSSKQTQI